MEWTRNPKTVGFVAAFVSATLMGFVGFFSRNVAAQGDFIAFGRMLIGMIMFFFIAMKMQGGWANIRKYKLSPAMIASGFFMGTCLSAYVASTQMTSIANAVFFIYIGPMISTILAVIFLKETLTPATIASCVAVFVGMILIIGLVQFPEGGGIAFGLSLKPEQLMGDLLALSSGVGYGLFLFFNRYRTEVPGDVRSFWNFVFAVAGILMLFLFTSPWASIAAMSSTQWMWWIATAFVCGFGALSLCTIANIKLRAVEFACVAYWECVVGVLVGILVFAEGLTPMTAIGGALIILGGVAETAMSILKKKRAAAAGSHMVATPAE